MKMMSIYFKILVLLLIHCFEIISGTGQKQRRTPLIVGGRPAKIEDIPYQVSMQLWGYHFCGGSIIARQYILTAAHCIDIFSEYGLRDTRIEYATDLISSGGLQAEIKRVFVHPEYDELTTNNDIAILMVKEPIEYSKLATSIALGKYEAMEGENALVSGWGATETGGNVTDQLLKTNVKIVSRESCNKAYAAAEGERIINRVICAASEGADSCQGDSGGPLVIGNVQVGIVSWGMVCADPKFPGVYTNIKKYQKFINQVTGNTVQWM